MFIKACSLTVLCWSVLCNLSFAQKANASLQYHIKRTSQPIKVDGVEDAGWIQAEEATDFNMVLPMDTSKAQVRTTVKMCFDDNAIYLIAICYKKSGQSFMVESLKRDFAFGKNDNFLLFMDPFNDQTNGFSFGSNAAGAQWDGIMYDGGRVDLNWDNKWTSSVKNYDDKWIFEAAIPFTTIRFKKNNQTWGINFSRLDITAAEKSSWAPVPRQFPTASLAYTGQLIWEEAVPETGSNISIIPYFLSGGTKNHQGENKTNYNSKIGVDAKVAVTSSLNLDLTVNPDFSQVDVDRQVTNLDRFELFFPERRQFFLENGDQFSNFGYSSIRPFFSRRIGLNAPIQFGARLSGKLNKDWRMGFMNMQTERAPTAWQSAQNYTVMALQRKVFSRSNIGILFVNRSQILKPDEKDARYFTNPYNRNIGLEYNLASANNHWTGKAVFLKSFSQNIHKEDWVHAASLQYSVKKWLFSWQQEYVGKQYQADVGFVPRKNYIKMSPEATRIFFSRNQKITSHAIKLASYNFFTEQFRQTDNTTYMAYTLTLRNQAVFTQWIAYDYVKLLQPFDPTNFGKDTLATGSKHQWNAFGTEFVSKPQQLFTYAFATRFGGYYQNGRRSFVSTEIGFRIQPYVSMSMAASMNHIYLPKPWNKTTFWLVGPRLDVTFTNTLFFTAFIQYNNQQKNININTRFQWRYKPASDIFIVYTDNYFPAPFNVKNRALVLKLNYWWNR